MALSRSPSLLSSSATSDTSVWLPHWTSIEHEDNLPGCASVLDMDDTSSCAEIELDPPSHHRSGVDKTQSEPTPLLRVSPSPEIGSSKSLPSTLDQILSASNHPNGQIPRYRDVEPNVPQGRPVNLENELPASTAQHTPGTGQHLSWLTSMIDFLSQFNELKDDHYSLVERVKCYEDAFGNLTGKVQKFTTDLLLDHFGHTGLNNGAAGTREGRMGSSSADNLQFEQTEHVQRPPCATNDYSAPIPSSTLQDMNADAVCSGSEHASATLETGTTIDRTHPPIILRLQRGPTIVRTSIGPTRRSARLDSAKDAAYISRKVNATAIPNTQPNKRQKK